MDASLLQSLGVVDWGYTEDLSPISYEHYLQWLEDGHHGSLSYLCDERAEKRKHLQEVFPACQSAVVFLFSYAEKKYAVEQEKLGEAKIAGYVTSFAGVDYHFLLRQHLETIATSLQQHYPSLVAKPSLDVLPVLERDLAVRAGLGWFGKNSMLIHRREGSFTMIGALLLDQKLDLPERPLEVDHCGQCRACVEACPTIAIDEKTRTLKADLCVSTYTIEVFKDAPAPKGYEDMQEIFGCDICQDVCPWNKHWLRERLKKSPLPQFDWAGLEMVRDTFLVGTFKDVAARITQLGVREFKRLFAATPLARTGRNGMLKNLLHKRPRGR